MHNESVVNNHDNKEVLKMALSNIAEWNDEKGAAASCGSACGAKDEKPAACGAADEKPAACGASDVPAACGAGDEKPSACGADDK